MRVSYKDWTEMESAPLLRAAGQLWMERKTPCTLAPLILMTDPNVHDDVVAAAEAMPTGSAIIYRHFGEDNRLETAKRLRALSFERQQQLLIGNDPELAIEVGADGVHFTRDATLTAPSVWKRRIPGWIVTMAGIKGDYRSYTGDLSVLNALIVSSVFESESSSAGEPIGTKIFSELCADLPVPIIALGGVNASTALKLINSGASGLAARFNISHA